MSNRQTLVLALIGLVTLLAGTAVPAEASEGMELYNKKCAMCHGKDGVAKAMAKGSANLNDAEWQKATSVEAIVKVTAEGKNKMPKFEGKLTPEQIRAIAEYVKHLK